MTPSKSDEVMDAMSSSDFEDEPLYDDGKQYSGLLEED